MINHRIRRAVASAARPYIYRELPAWGRVFRLFVGDHRREWLWQDQHASVTDKTTGYSLDLDLGWWSDRMTYFLGRWYDLQSQLIMDRFVKRGDIVVDVGANRGMFALYAAKKVGEAGKVICFEPNPTCLTTLRQTISDNGITNIEVRAAGLSDKSETLNLMVPSCDNGIATFASYGEQMHETAVACPVLVGDDALRDIVPSFIKVDVEGFEPRVITGLSNIIRKHKPLIYMEFVPEHLARSGSSPEAMIDLMTRYGYAGARVSYHIRPTVDCTYTDLTPPFRECDVLWKPN